MSNLPYHSSRQRYDYLVLKTSMEFACIDYLKGCVPIPEALSMIENLYEQVEQTKFTERTEILVLIDDKEFAIPFYDKKDALLYVTYLYQIVEEKLNGEVQ